MALESKGSFCSSPKQSFCALCGLWSSVCCSLSFLPCSPPGRRLPLLHVSLLKHRRSSSSVELLRFRAVAVVVVLLPGPGGPGLADLPDRTPEVNKVEVHVEVCRSRTSASSTSVHLETHYYLCSLITVLLSCTCSGRGRGEICHTDKCKLVSKLLQHSPVERRHNIGW